MLPPLLKDKRLYAIFGVTLVSIMGVSSIGSSLPTISRGLDFPIEQVGLIITFFTLPGLLFTPVAGMLADRYGRKRILIPALLLFCLGGVACHFAVNLPMLLACRFVQGMGAAPLGALQATLVADLYSGNERSLAMGLNTSALNLGTAILPAFGGLVALWGWNKPFLLPLFALPVAFACKRLPLPSGRRTESFGSYMGSLFAIVRRKETILLLLLPLVAFCIFYGALVTFFPVLSDTRFHMPAHSIGLVFATSSVSAALVAALTERLVCRFSSPKLLIAAPFFFGLGVLLVPHMPGYYLMIAPILCFGVGLGLMPNIQLLLVQLAPPAQRGVIMSLYGWTLRGGQTTGPLLGTLVFTVCGLNAVFHFFAILAVCMLLLALQLPKALAKNAQAR